MSKNWPKLNPNATGVEKTLPSCQSQLNNTPCLLFRSTVNLTFLNILKLPKNRSLANVCERFCESKIVELRKRSKQQIDVRCRILVSLKNRFTPELVNYR